MENTKVKTMITAKELFDKMLSKNNECTSTEMMIEFAKYHVEKALKQASKKVNTVIQTRIVTETKYVRDIKVVNRDVIKQVEKIIDSKCEITPETINILNSAAQNEPAIRGNE